MKKALLLLIVFFVQFGAVAQLAVDKDSIVSGPQVIERSSNHRIWQSVRRVAAPNGDVFRSTNTYTEVGTGICYVQNAEWVDAAPEIVIAQDGSGIGQKTQSTARFAADILADGGIQLNTPNGSMLRSHIIGICLYDWKNRQSSQIASARSTAGTLVCNNQVIYAGAFDGVNADVRYTYKESGLGQDVIIREQLPAPADFQMDPATTRVEVWTEFLNPPPVTTQNVQDANTGEVFQNVIDFGDVHFGRGAAFSIGGENPSTVRIAVRKQWVQAQGRFFLVESIPYSLILPKLSALPAKQQAAINDLSRVRTMASVDERTLPSRQQVRSKTSKRLQTASLNLEPKGVVSPLTIAPISVNHIVLSPQ